MKIAVNPTTIESAPLFLAGARADSGVELVGGKIPLLLDGTADAATNAETQALLYSLEHPGLRIILTVAECGYRVVARRSRGIGAPRDLKNKTVGTTRHTSAHYYVVELARKAGLREADLEVVDLPQSDMPAALAQGRIDALSIWEPIAERARVAVAEDAVVFHDPALFRERFNLNTTTAVLRDPKRRAGLVGFVRQVMTAARETRDRPAAIWPLLAAKIDLPEETISRLWPQFRFPADLPDDLGSLIDAEEKWLARSQNRPPRTPEALAGLIDRTVISEAMGGGIPDRSAQP